MGANGATGEVSAVRMPQGESLVGVTTWAETHICAAHRPVDGGPLHGHTWRIRVYWQADGSDAEELQRKLRLFCTILDHCELPATLSRAESIAAYVGRAIAGEPTQVDVWREAEGLGARWQR